MSAILPGSTIGILGGGQLGRMTAMAARSLGYRVQAMDPDPSCPARFVVDACFEGGWDDPRAAANLARGCDVVTLEIEQISMAALEAAGRYAPVRPSAEVLRIVQDRIRQKQWLRENGFPVGPDQIIRTGSDLDDLVTSAVDSCGRFYLKRAQGGYDGRGQIKLDLHSPPADLLDTPGQRAAAAWSALGEAPCVAEQALDLELEISVMAARSPGGEIRAFPAAANYHENQILAWSVIPSPVSKQVESSAREIAVSMAELLKLEGLLAVEMFLTRSGELYVNELAPRPHNSYHASERCCVTSQFEQAVRAVCDLPLGDVRIIRPGAIANLLGDLWLDLAPGNPKSGNQGQEREPRFDRALAIPEVRLHLYEKHIPRRGRKMGHLSATADTPEEAVARVLKAKEQL